MIYQYTYLIFKIMITVHFFSKGQFLKTITTILTMTLPIEIKKKFLSQRPEVGIPINIRMYGGITKNISLID